MLKHRELRKEAESKRRIASEAAQVQIGAAKLPGIGTDTWNAMWEAARTYSATAYPGQAYPVTVRELESCAARRLRVSRSAVGCEGPTPGMTGSNCSGLSAAGAIAETQP